MYVGEVPAFTKVESLSGKPVIAVGEFGVVQMPLMQV
jgi:hypothetical protein